ncbi:hypothetical protein BOVA604_3735 [Bacteroides ovatus]|nr:hypothetical protein BOVA604_3735 [Bacteroides ovatus]
MECLVFHRKMITKGSSFIYINDLLRENLINGTFPCWDIIKVYEGKIW